MPQPLYARRSARVLLLDAAGSVLLLRFGEPGGGDLWLTPGGGVEPGEDLPVAAARELREEVGLVVDPSVLRPVATTSGYADLGWVDGTMRDDYFLHEVDGHVVDHAGHTEWERRHYRGHRWWTAAQLRTTTEKVYPLGLADLVDDVRAGRLPDHVVDLPWH